MEPLVKFHDLDGELQDQYFYALGKFMHRFTETEADLYRALRSFIASYVGRDKSKDADTLVEITTADAPLRPLLDMAEALWRLRYSPGAGHLEKLARVRTHLHALQQLRNLLAHQPADFSPFTEIPFVVDKGAKYGKSDVIRDFVSLDIPVLEAAAEDAPKAGYLYRAYISDPNFEAEDQAEPWRYRPDMLSRERLRWSNDSQT